MVVLAMDTAVACEAAPVPLGHSPGASENTDVRACMEVHASRTEVPSHHWNVREKNDRVGSIGVDQNSLTLSSSLLL